MLSLSSSASLILSTVLLSLCCLVTVLSLPVGNDYQLSTNGHFSVYPGNLINRAKRVRLPVGRTVIISRGKRGIAEEDERTDNSKESVAHDFDDDDDEEELANQIDDLNDDELAILARIVQDELDRYNPDIAPVEEYQIVRLPRGLDGQSVVPYFDNDDDDNAGELTIFSGDQPEIVRPVIELPEDEIYEANTGEQMDKLPEYVLVPAEEVLAELPTEVVEDEVVPIDEDTLDDLELRTRIAGLADALNERAIRGL